MTDPGYQSIFEALFICPWEWLLKSTGPSGLTSFKKPPLSPHLCVPINYSHTSWPYSAAMCNFTVCQVCLLVLLCGELISQCRARDYAIVPFGGMHLQCMACYTATIPFMKTTWSSDRKYYEWSGKAWENQRLKGLKFPSLIYLLLLPKGTQNPKGSSRPKPDYKNYGGFVFPLVGEWKPCYEPTINHNKPAAHG